MIFVGFFLGIRGYRLWDPYTHKITIAFDVDIDEEIKNVGIIFYENTYRI
jgi:hypothetical protein